MPLYTYRCPSGHSQEKLKGISDRHKSEACPECGQYAEFIPSLPGSIKFAVPGVKGHYTTNADGSGTRC